MTKSQQFNNMTLDLGDTRKEEKYSFIDARDASTPVLIPSNDSSESCSYTMTTKKLLEKRRNVYPLCGLLLGGVLVIWLIGLTMVREFQLSALRQDVEKLQIDVNDLKTQRKFDEGLIDDLKGFEDQLNAEDNMETSTQESFDDDIEEDEDYAEDDYDEDDSLEGPDFLGEVMEVNVVDKSRTSIGDEQPPIRKIMKIWKQVDDVIEQGRNEHDRSKREVIGETANGVPVIAESYREARDKNMTYRSNQIITPPSYRRDEYENQKPKMFLDWDMQRPMELTRQRKKTTSQTTTQGPSPVFTRQSRVMSTDEDKSKAFRRVIRIRKPMTRVGLTSDYDAALLERKPEAIGMTRIHRPRKSHNPNSRRNLENTEEIETLESASPRRRPRPPMVAHFSGDTTNYSMEKHEHYDGNGRLRHPHDVPYTAWSAAPWLSSMDLDAYFRLQDGAVSVPSSGIYFVYAQIFFHDAHDTNGFQVYRNTGVHDESILQCSTMTHSKETMEKSNTCYTAGAFHLNKGDTIFVKNIGSMRYSIMQAGKSFFGLFKLSEMRVR